jgi:ketosteroid isomerase-like protein
MTPEEAVAAFVARINSHDLVRLGEMMTDDHLFIDPLDNRLGGREAILAAWGQYFAMVPDYWIRLEAISSSQQTVAAFGRAGGTYAPTGVAASDNHWEVPAAWRAEIQGDRVASWQVYADNLPMRRLIGVEKS